MRALRTTARLSPTARAYGAVAALTALVVGLGAIRLDSRSIWLDESTSIWYAQHTWRALLDVVAHEDTNMSAYYGALWLWRHLFGDGVLAMRSLSVLAAALTILAVYAVGARLFGRPAGLIAAALLATNAFFLRYAQEARGYALATLLVTLASYFFLGELERPSARNRVGYVACSVLAIYAHFFAAYVTLVQVGYLAAVKRREAWSRAWVGQYVAIALLLLPIAYLSATLPGDPIGWIQPSGWPELREAVRQLAGNSGWRLGVFLAVAVLSIPVAARSPGLRARLAYPAAWFLVPVVLSFAVSLAEPMFLPKYLIVCVPALALFAGGVIASLRSRALSTAALAVVLALSIQPLVNWYERPPLEDWQAVTRYVLEQDRDDDAIVLYRHSLPYEYYASHSDSRTPTWVGRDANWPSLASLPNPRLWVVLSQPRDAAGAIRQAMDRGGYELRERRAFGEGVTVELFARPS
ncbi:MAG TPA: glycosyltransferase family 39 protein [Gaiellaceae bacterium]|nr:glycosyltransferase family 39 protein [Gaiellaceae bacterium]